MSTDRIQKKMLLHAPRARVWRALADSREFGTWFGVKFDGPFVPGTTLRGAIHPTQVDAEVGQAQKQHEGKTFEIMVEKMEPERLFSMRWHPHAVDHNVDYSTEPTTLIEFLLEEAEGGILLTVTESGFDQIPLARRAEAFKSNEQGWGMMIRVVAKYVSDAS